MFCFVVDKYKHGFIPIFLTKNLDSIRTDIMIKMNKGCIPIIINDLCCNDRRFQEFDDDNKNFFLPRLNQLSDLKKYYKSNSENYSTCDGFVIGMFLMNKSNYDYMVKFANMARKKQHTIVFIIDEYHVWFPGQKEFINNNGSIYNTESNTISSLDITHWIHSILNNKQHYIIGISATPFRILTDVVLYPHKDQIVYLESSPPVINFKYYIILKITTTVVLTKKIVKILKLIRYDYTDEEYVFKIIRSIQSERNMYEEIPLVLINVMHINDKQKDLKDKLDKSFKNQLVKTELFNQKNNDSLVDLFDKFEPYMQAFEKEGIFIIIGDRRADTGITVKPTKPDQLKYVWGITDQIIGKFTHMEAIIQKLRILGWYPENHKSTLWVREDEKDVYDYHIWQLNHDIIKNYNGTPKSISTLSTQSEIIKHITSVGPNDAYRLTKKKLGWLIRCVNKNEITNDVEVINTTFEIIGNITNEFNNMKLSDLKGKNSEKKKLREHFKFKHGNFSQIGYDQKRRKLLIDCCFQPGIKKFNGESRGVEINTMIIPPPHKTVDCFINECLLINFVERWENRTKISENKNKKLAFQVTDTDWYMYDGDNQILEVRTKNKYDNFKISKTHDASMRLIDELDKHKEIHKQKKSNNVPDVSTRCNVITQKGKHCQKLVKFGKHCHLHSG